ncbi:hypothetical protein ACWENA_08170 [Streptomyces sp. NPDC004779]
MIIVHTPSDGGPVEHYDFRTVRTAEAARITTLLTVKMPWQDVRKELADEHPDVMRVIAYVIKCRTEPELRIGDFDPVVSDLAVRLDHREVEEWGEVAAGMVASFDGSPELLEAQLSTILDEAADADHARGVIERILAGKFPPAPSETTGPGSGPTTGESTSSGASSSGSSPTSSTSTPDSSTS